MSKWILRGYLAIVLWCGYAFLSFFWSLLVATFVFGDSFSQSFEGFRKNLDKVWQALAPKKTDFKLPAWVDDNFLSACCMLLIAGVCVLWAGWLWTSYLINLFTGKHPRLPEAFLQSHELTAEAFQA